MLPPNSSYALLISLNADAPSAFVIFLLCQSASFSINETPFPFTVSAMST